MNYLTRAIQNSGKIHHVTVAHATYATHLGIHHTMLEHKNLGNEGTFDICIKTPARTRVHFNYFLEATKALRVQVYEGSVVTGVTKNSRSRNLIEDNAKAPVIITLDGTVTNVGVLKADVVMGVAGATPLTQGGTDAGDEFIYPELFTVRFRCTSQDTDNNVKMRMNFIIEPMLDSE